MSREIAKLEFKLPFCIDLKISSRIDIDHLSHLTVLAMGFLLIRLIRDFFPTINPLCGPPSSLSPEKVVILVPIFTTSLTKMFVGIPLLERSNVSPQPRSAITGIRFFLPKVTSSEIPTFFVNPEIV